MKRSLLAVVVVCAAVALGGCPQFHPEPLPGRPTGDLFADIDGVHVHYEVNGTGPAVVLLHGFGASMDSWGTVYGELMQTHRVIALDLKGFGWTSRPDGDYSPAAQAELVWHLLDKLGVTDVAIVGHSWGTSVALSMAVAHPERTRKVALYDAYVYDEQVPSFFRWAQKGGIGEVLFSLFYKERIEDRAPLAYYDERWVTQARIDRVERDMDKPGTVAAALAVARGHHFAALHRALASFDRPVLLLWGEEDQVTPISFGYRLVGELQHAELKTYPHCGHMPMVEAHARSTADLIAFLADAPTPTPATTTTPTPTSTPADAGGDAKGGGGGGASATFSSTIAPSVHASSTHASTTLASSTLGSPTASSTHASSTLASSTLASSTLASSTVASSTPTVAPTPTPLPLLARPDQRDTSGDIALPLGADLAALGLELTPRLYAAPRDKTEVVLHGAVRMREAALYNLDLDRGLDTAGKPLFPVPLSGGQLINAGDLRARTDVAVYARGVGVAAKARIDWLDNVAIGGSPDLAGGSPATSGGQRPTAVVIKRAWGEALTPAGTLAVGRMGAHFGLGIAANGGDCEDCDHGDAADRIAFVSPIAGHLIAIAHDFTARGPFTPSRDGGHPVELEPSTAVSGQTLAIFKIHSPATLARRADAGLVSVEYAAFVSRRSQDNDVPATYLPTAVPATTYTSADLVARGFTAVGTGAWLRITGARFRIETELDYLHANLAQPSLIPGTEITTPVTSSQLGAALQSDIGGRAARIGLDAGYASGDDAPGFGAFPKPNQTSTVAGQFDGPQANLPRDHTVDNFRFHPDYHIDQILFREIIGTITDAVYLRPHARATLMTVGPGRLEAIGAVIASWAVQPTSTPSGQRALGVELDPELRYASRDGFAINFAYGLLFPGAGFDGASLPAKPAQCFRLRMGFAF